MSNTVTRPEAMNATTNHAKVKLNVRLSDPLYVAGSAIAGKMEMECKADKGLGLGMLKVELFAVEGSSYFTLTQHTLMLILMLC
jgi:hypothetical protein